MGLSQIYPISDVSDVGDLPLDLMTSEFADSFEGVFGSSTNVFVWGVASYVFKFTRVLKQYGQGGQGLGPKWTKLF